MGRLTDAERHEAIGMMVVGGISYRAVSRYFRCSQKTMRNFMLRNEESGSVVDRQRLERRRVTTCQQDRHIVLLHLRDRSNSTRYSGIDPSSN